MTRKLTAWRICLSSSKEVPTLSGLLTWIQFSSSARPVLTYSPLLKEQHSLLSSSWLKSWTLMKAKTCLKSLRTRNLGTWVSLSSCRRDWELLMIWVQSLPTPPRLAGPPWPLFLSAAFEAARPRGAWMQLFSVGAMSFLMLSRSSEKIFCTKASSCCLKSSAGYLASTCFCEDGLSAWGAGDREKMPLVLKAKSPDGARLLLCMPLSEGGRTYFLKRASRVTEFVSQWARTSLLS
mmetsp:Transcript_10616/g.21944  ORF Transcript_10616/g.21944 Transcript_10616/m.21944 type:complete len:236 (+) Transcript_10616:385-1092(+)